MRAVLVGVIAFGLLLCVVSASAESSRRDSTLLWDDGVVDYWQDGMSYYYTKIAVRFVAPEWAAHVTEVQLYLRGHDGGGTSSFAVRLWERSDVALGDPEDPLCDPVLAAVTGSAGQWVSVVLPVPVSIENCIQFDAGVFYAGLEWLEVGAPDVGIDLSEPWDGATWFFNYPTEWFHIQGDALIRAVVTDEYASPVESTSWARIKAMMR